MELLSLWKGFFYWVLLGFTESLLEVCLIRNWNGFSGFELGYIGFYWVFTGFH